MKSFDTTFWMWEPFCFWKLKEEESFWVFMPIKGVAHCAMERALTGIFRNIRNILSLITRVPASSAYPPVCGGWPVVVDQESSPGSGTAVAARAPAPVFKYISSLVPATVSTQYLHSIYTVSTPYLQINSWTPVAPIQQWYLHTEPSRSVVASSKLISSFIVISLFKKNVFYLVMFFYLYGLWKFSLENRRIKH